MSRFEEILEEEYEKAKEYGKLWAQLDHLKSIVTKDVMKRENWDDEFVMYLLGVDEKGYRELHNKLATILKDPELLKQFEERTIVL